MGAVLHKVKRLLREKFPPPAKIQLKEEEGIVGAVISDAFQGMPSLDRINLIWDFLEQRLSKDEANEVVLLLAVTPEEEMLHSA